MMRARPRGRCLWTGRRPPSGRGSVGSLIDVEVQWKDAKPYGIEELRRNFLDAVEHDDDILTQFVHREALFQRIRACESFEELVLVWEWLSAEHFDED